MLLHVADSYNISVTLETVDLESDLFSTIAQVGVVDELPMQGVDFLLGNDLTGCCVTATPNMRAEISELKEETVRLEESFSDLFTTRARRKRMVDDD